MVPMKVGNRPGEWASVRKMFRLKSGTLIMLGMFGWQVANQKKYEDTVPKVTLDWDTPGFGRGFASMVIFRYGDPILYSIHSSCRDLKLLKFGNYD